MKGGEPGKRPFFIVGPTGVGKSEIAAEVAARLGAEIVGADAFQVYQGFELLSAKPAPQVLLTVPHRLIGSVPLNEEMNAERFRVLALAALEEIHARGKVAFVVGGSGMYVQALTHGLSPLPPARPELRARLDELSAGELLLQLQRLDPKTAATIDAQNKRRLLRAVEICLLTRRPASEQRQHSEAIAPAAGVLLLREREELYQHINARVEAMFIMGVVDEVRQVGQVGHVGPTADKMLGLEQVRELLAGRISEAACIASIQQATRHYAKRQLTWFRRQSNFEPLNLSHCNAAQAIEWIAGKARLSFADRG